MTCQDRGGVEPARTLALPADRADIVSNPAASADLMMTDSSYQTSLYDTDIVTWADQQVAELRRLAASTPGNAVDWANVIEEIECVGRGELASVESLLENALVHILKALCDPGSLSKIAWSVETAGFFRQMRKRFRNSMRQQISLDETWRDAFRGAADALHSYGISIPPRIPATCPFTLDEMLDEAFTYEGALHRLHALIENPQESAG